MMQGLEALKVNGQYPISVSTSVAFEKFYEDKGAAKPTYQSYDVVWINARTIYRNILGCAPKDMVARLTADEVAMSMDAEMGIIRNLIAVESRETLKTEFYISGYTEIPSKYKAALLRMDTTDIQKHYTNLFNKTVEEMTKNRIIEHHGVRVSNRGIDIPGTDAKKSALLVSHYPFDLLSAHHFHHMDLLETHTGAIKGRDKWSTKYFNGSQLPVLPMSGLLLPVFGDKEHFRPMDKSAIADILGLASKYNWNSVTTKEKILYGVNTLRNDFLKNTIKSFL